jgi:DNA repair exonuclease SbcCD nuclease subunit
MRILHTADLHLKEYGDERWEALEELIEVGRKEKINLLVISGDLFDTEVEVEKLRPHLRSIFSDNDFKILIIPGNHDKSAYTKGMYWGEDVTILTHLHEPFELETVRVWGMPFENIEGREMVQKIRTLEDRLIPDKTNILLYHGELVDSYFAREDFGEEGEGRYMPVKLSYFEGLNLQYILGGHFHSRYNVWEVEKGKYFVYPGSPVSITKKETGQRKANIFEIGEPPQEYLLDTLHFEEVTLKLDPFDPRHPLDILENYLKNLHPKAQVLLTVSGYLHGEKLGMGEEELVEKVRKLASGKIAGENYQFRDISRIWEDDLFKKFLETLEKEGVEEEEKKHLSDLVLQAIMEVRI